MRSVMLLLAVLMIVPVVSASYISGEVDIGNSGIVYFDDVDLGFGEETQELTSKDGGLWVFDLEVSEVYSYVDLAVCFPENLESIENVESNLLYRVNVGKRVCLEFLDEGKNVDVRIDYTLDKEDINYSIYVFVVVLIVIIVYLVRKLLKKRKKGFSDIEHLINENEKKILDVLMKGQVRQKTLRKDLDMPKASFSRYLINLEKKKLILREGEGKNKIVKLK